MSKGLKCGTSNKSYTTLLSLDDSITNKIVCETNLRRTVEFVDKIDLCS